MDGVHRRSGLKCDGDKPPQSGVDAGGFVNATDLTAAASVLRREMQELTLIGPPQTAAKIDPKQFIGWDLACLLAASGHAEGV